MSAKHHVEMVANYHCRCGEGPLWDERRQVLFWTDIPAGRLFRYDRVSGRHEPIYQGEPAGGFTLQQDGSLLLFGADRISRMGDDGRVEVLIDGIDPEMDRFNDVIADPQGRVYAGTMADDPQRGGLYRVDIDGSVRCLFRGTGCSNGMWFTPDRRGFDHTAGIPVRLRPGHRRPVQPRRADYPLRSRSHTRRHDAGRRGQHLVGEVGRLRRV